jgi:hypothetical protein
MTCRRLVDLRERFEPGRLRQPACCHGGPSWTRTRSQWIKNPSKSSQHVANGAKSGDEQCPIATDQTPDAVSKPLPAFSRASLIASLYQHAAALAETGDIEAARVAHGGLTRLFPCSWHGTLLSKALALGKSVS